MAGFVYIASPYRGEVERNRQYAVACLRDSLERGETPVVPHLMYPEALNDDDPEERGRGMLAAMRLMSHAAALCVYEDFGVSQGMAAEISAAMRWGIPIRRRRLTVRGVCDA